MMKGRYREAEELGYPINYQLGPDIHIPSVVLGAIRDIALTQEISLENLI